MEREINNTDIEFDLNAQLEKERVLAKYEGPDRIVSNYELLDELHEQQTTAQPIELKSKIPTLDHYIHAFYGGELTVISGPTGNGKTLFGQTLTRSFSDQGKKVLWFTYEVSAWDFINFFDDPKPLFLMPRELKQSSVTWLENRIIEAKLKHGIDAVFIDHLHYLLDLGKNYNASLEIGRVMRFLKMLAVDLNIHIFLLAHVRKLNDEDEPDNDSLRDSSLVSQEAANILFVWRLKNTENESKLKISKNRRFGVFDKKIHLERHGKYLREVFDEKTNYRHGENNKRHHKTERRDIYDSEP